jgi:hypothetical protein
MEFNKARPGIQATALDIDTYCTDVLNQVITQLSVFMSRCRQRVVCAKRSFI